VTPVLVFQTFDARHLTPCEFSDICRQTFNAHLNFQTFVARTFNARLNFQTFVARTFNAHLKGEMHKKAYEHIWLHFFCFFWFLSFFTLVPPWKLWKKSSVNSDLNVSIKRPWKKEAFAESFIKIDWKLKKRQPNVLIFFYAFPLLICEPQSIWHKLLVLSWL